MLFLGKVEQVEQVADGRHVRRHIRFAAALRVNRSRNIVPNRQSLYAYISINRNSGIYSEPELASQDLAQNNFLWWTMRNKKLGIAERAFGKARREENALGNDKSADGFRKMDEAIGEGSIAVFADIKTPPFAAQSELIELKIILPSRWSSQLLERIEKCIDDFGIEKGAGKAKTIGEGSSR